MLSNPPQKRKRCFIDIINEEEHNHKRVHHRSHFRTHKRRRLNYDPTHSLSIPYQSLINPYKWLKTRHPSQQRQQHPHRTQQHSRAPIAKPIKQRDDGELSALLRFMVNSNPLHDSDALICKWHNILSGLSLELFRNHFILEEYNNHKDTLSSVPNAKAASAKRNVYLAKLKEQSNDDYFNLFGNGKLIKYAFSCISQIHLVSYLPAFGEEEGARESLVISEEIKYEYYRQKLFKDTQANHRLYLFANGFSYISLDNFYFYTSSESTVQFTNFLDQCLIPPSWSNQALRSKFNEKFVTETQGQRYKRQTEKQKRYNNHVDDHVFASNFDLKRLSQQILSGTPYIDGNLFVEMIDMRYNEKDGELHRLLLSGQSAYHLSQSLDDLALNYTNNYYQHPTMCQLFGRVFEKQHIAKFQVLTQNYPFYRFYKSQLIRAYAQKYRECVQRFKNEKDRTRHDHADDFRHCICLQQMHDSYYPPHDIQKHLMVTHYQKLANKYTSSDRSKGIKKEVLREDLHRLIKFASNRINKNQIEKQIYLRLYPCLCLKPSMEVMQVMNYVHYLTRSSLVRPEHSHRGIAQKMKSYYSQRRDQHHHGKHEEQGKEPADVVDAEQMRQNNVIVDGIHQSQKFLHYIAKHGEQKLFKMFESMRNETKYLYDFGEKYEKPSEPRKNPGFAIPKYSEKHYQPKCCILKEQNPKERAFGFPRDKLIILRIDFLQSSDVEIWLFSVTQIRTNDGNDEKAINYQYYLNNYELHHIVYSQECLSLNCAAKLFHQHLRYQLYQHSSQLVYSENTKFDGLLSNQETEDDHNDIFEIL